MMFDGYSNLVIQSLDFYRHSIAGDFRWQCKWLLPLDIMDYYCLNKSNKVINAFISNQTGGKKCQIPLPMTLFFWNHIQY